MDKSEHLSESSNIQPPFKPSSQLCDELILREDNEFRLCSRAEDKQPWLPGQPRVLVNSTDLMPYLRSQFTTPRLDKLSPHLWLIATQSSSHISALHDQIVRGRNVVISEKPELHLLWYENRVFLKPIPRYWFSYDFWRFICCNPSVSEEEKIELLRSIRGFMRSYFFLIQHESDFRIAKSEHLIPANIGWQEFGAFIAEFANVIDDEVSPRYSFGELRLSRLNLWAKIVLHEWQFQKISWQYGDFFGRFFAPILFIFGALSVALSAMQVGVGARPSWNAFLSVSAWFSVFTLAIFCLISVVLASAFIFMVFRELEFAMRAKLKKSKRKRVDSC